jgi:hypothetical protein
MSKGFLWFAQNNNSVDYAKLSIELAKSIKKQNNNNNICVIVDQKTIFKSDYIDKIVILKDDDSANDQIKFANEYKAFYLSPFTHTIKLEADILFTSSTDWWWNHLCQHDLVFAINCRNYHDDIIKKTIYRRLFQLNHLPDIYSGLTYFRKSHRAEKFFNLCKDIAKSWLQVRDEILINCHDAYPTTDVTYALAYRIMDPINSKLIDYEWFKFIHGKPAINDIQIALEQYNYLYPVKLSDKSYLGGSRLHRIWHYHDKKLMESMNERTF